MISYPRRTLLNIGWRYLARHPWQSGLMILGITLGVAVAVAIDLANASASRAFDLSTEAVTGRATHQIIGGPQGLEESIYVGLRTSGLLRTAAPVVSAYVSSPQLGDRPLQLLGVDPFAEAPFRSYLAGPQSDAVSFTGDLATFLTRPGAAFISSSLAERYGLVPCSDFEPTETGERDGSGQLCEITLVIAGQARDAFIAGLLEPGTNGNGPDRLNQRALDGLIMVDLATAQELTGQLGRLDRIDLILPETCQNIDPFARQRSLSTNPAQGIDADEECPAAGAIRALLPAEAALQPVEARRGTVEQMTAAFRLNLTALSLLALIVGMFLIYNTMTFSVLQRRQLFGTLRCLGVTRQEVFALVTGEALVIGIIGAMLGIFLGVILGQGAVRLVTQTINDLYFTVTVRGVQIPASSLIKGALLGIIATVLTAALPAWEAASVPPRAALSRAGLERKAGQAVTLAAYGGLVLSATGAAVLLAPAGGLGASFAGTFAVIVGFAMLAPLVTKVIMRLAIPLSGRVWGSLGRMAPRNVVASLSRTSVAVAALMVAVSVTIGVSLMVSSFRHTVINWLDQTLQGDIYISAPGMTATRSWTILDPRGVVVASSWPGVERVDLLRSANIESPLGPVHVAATDNPTLAQERIFLAAYGTAEQVQESLANGAVIVSEPLANRVGLPLRGGLVTLYTASGPRDFPVAGIYYDYASSQGLVMMDLRVYRQAWQDESLTALALRLAPGTNADQVADELEAALAPVQHLLVRPNQALRDDVLIVFDRTFAITGALQLLATVVAFIGILSALLSLQLERQRELGILRSVGLTTRQLWGLVMAETGLMGTVAGLLAMPTGFVLSLILVYIINRRSFGWTLQLQTGMEPFVLALFVAVVAALLAGIYPAYRISKIAAAEAMRYE